MYNLRDPKQRARYRRAVTKRRDSHFLAAERIIKRVFKAERQTMISALPKVGKPDRKAWELAFKQIWVMVGGDSWKFSEDIWGAAQQRVIPVRKPKMHLTPMMAMYLSIKQINPTWLQAVNDYIDAAGGEKIKEIGNVTKQRVKAALEEGIANEESIPALSKRIEELYSGFDSARATMIAQSETVDAFNQASLAQARDADSTLDLMWITAGDDRVRDEHQAMEDAGPIPYDQEFDCDDGTTMPGEAVNCRCTIGYAVPESKE